MIDLIREMRKIPARDWILTAFNMFAAWMIVVFWLVATP